MWIMWKGDLLNLDQFENVFLDKEKIILEKDKYDRILAFPDVITAKKSYGYLIEALRRGDKIINLLG